MKTLEWSSEIFGQRNHPRVQALEKDGWRLPTRNELLALFNSGEYPDSMNGASFWSSDFHAPKPNCEWFVYFGKGYTCELGSADSGFVRLVRNGQDLTAGEKS